MTIRRLAANRLAACFPSYSSATLRGRPPLFFGFSSGDFGFGTLPQYGASLVPASVFHMQHIVFHVEYFV